MLKMLFALSWLLYSVSAVVTSGTLVPLENVEIAFSGLNLSHAGTLQLRFFGGEWWTISVTQYDEQLRRFVDQTCKILHLKAVTGLAFDSSFGRGEGKELRSATWVTRGGKTYLDVVTRERDLEHKFDLGIVCRPNTTDPMVKDMEINLTSNEVVKIKLSGVEGGFYLNQMTKENADVLCRSAGFPAGATAPYFEEDSSEFGNHYLWIFRADCVGDEPTFADCPFVTFGVRDTWKYNRGSQDSGNHGTKLHCNKTGVSTTEPKPPTNQTNPKLNSTNPLTEPAKPPRDEANKVTKDKIHDAEDFPTVVAIVAVILVTILVIMVIVRSSWRRGWQNIQNWIRRPRGSATPARKDIEMGFMA